MSKKQPVVLVVDGPIGAGKSTLVDHLAEGARARGLEVVTVPEPVGKWKDAGILQKFYEAGTDEELRAHVTYNFQTYTFVTRVQATVEAAEANPGADLFILERSVFTDRFVFMELQREIVGKSLMSMYEEWWAMWARVMPFAIDFAVFLRPALETCQERVASRAREGEVGSGDDSARGGVSAGYQRRLCRAHEEFFGGKYGDAAPFKKMFTVGGALADGDFRTPTSPGTPGIVEKILAEVCGP